MSAEQIFALLVLGFALLQYLASLFKRERQRDAEHAAEPELEFEPQPDMHGERFRGALHEPRSAEVALESPPRLAVPVAGAFEHPKRPARPRTLPVDAARRPTQPARPESEWTVRIMAGDRAALRRAVAMMAILGPPRALDPPER